MKTQQRTHLGAALLWVAAASLLSGCTPTTMNVCPSIGWANNVDVEFIGSPDAVASIETMEVCGAETCWEAPRPLATPTTPPGASEAFEGLTVEVTDRRWTLRLDLERPESVTVTALTADGTVLGTAESNLEWTRVGGTAECGGPHHGGVVELTVAD